jgi:hypothetical protein
MMTAKMMVVAVLFTFTTISGAWAQAKFTTGSGASSARHFYHGRSSYRHGYARGHQY